MIAPEGWPFAVIPLFAGGILWFVGWPISGVLLMALGVFALFFFRNPTRNCSFHPGTACAPADGKVIKICPSPAELVRRGLPKQVSIFMSVFNVHVNRAAIDGELTEYSYNTGRKFSAFKDKASLENEQNLSVWDGPSGTIALKQIAGLVARRIVFDHSPGDTVRRGDRIGLIRYGSRVDVFLPDDATILVEEGDRVRAGESAIAELTGNAST
jgi:phosphatidylserine decarboxylase